jgi:hypothetical protein
LNHAFPIRAILGCLFVGGFCLCGICIAQDADTISSPVEDPDVQSAATVLVNQLSGPIEARDKAATALQTMGKNAAKPLADFITLNLPLSNQSAVHAVTKAITIVSKIGKDVGADTDITQALVLAAKQEHRRGDWSRLQLRLAAIDALAAINRYRGAILGNESSSQSSGDEYADPDGSTDLPEAIKASKQVVSIADTIFYKLSHGRPATTPTPSPIPTPTPTPTPPAPVESDGDFYECFRVLQRSQTRLVKLAGQIKIAATGSSRKTDGAFSRLADANALAESLKKIELRYLDATKTTFSEKAADQTDDKPHWQLKTEASYDLVAEANELNYQLHSLSHALKKGRQQLRDTLQELQNICEQSVAQPECRSETTGDPMPDCVLIGEAAANAINAIFSKPPETEPSPAAVKKEGQMDGDKKQPDKKADAAGDNDKAKSKTQ